MDFIFFQRTLRNANLETIIFLLISILFESNKKTKKLNGESNDDVNKKIR